MVFILLFIRRLPTRLSLAPSPSLPPLLRLAALALTLPPPGLVLTVTPAETLSFRLVLTSLLTTVRSLMMVRHLTLHA
jgi:hypothetical protein